MGSAANFRKRIPAGISLIGGHLAFGVNYQRSVQQV
jgi:hypothetical protein